jgi:hypothetical protein
MSNDKKSGMTLLEFIDRNGAGLAYFVIIAIVIVGGMILEFYGHK